MTDPGAIEGTYIRFISLGIAPGRKTNRWRVETKEDEGYLGVVKWFGRWRKYAFFPAESCVFEELCMQEISLFIETQTREKRTRMPLRGEPLQG